MTVYALLVGIDKYLAPSVPELGGCKHDVEHAHRYLMSDLDTKVDSLILRDGEATRVAVVDAIRTHLGRAQAGDTALFWFSGHGSYARCPKGAWFAEPMQTMQTLVCADSRTPGVPDLWDKELSVLLDDVAEHAGHVAVVLDSCHSDGATRDLDPDVREVPPADEHSLDSLIPELTRRVAEADGPKHIAMAACHSFEKARERLLGSEVRGVFSWSLLGALKRLGPSATYRELAAAAKTEVQQRLRDQTPQLRPAASDLQDHAFLSPKRGVPGAVMRMRWARDGWEIDAGAVHGLQPEAGLRVGIRGDRAGREALVAAVQPHRSLVDPMGWQPLRDRQYPMVVTHVPLPRLTVEVIGSDPAAIRRLTDDLCTAGPGGGPSPHVRVAQTGPDEPGLRAAVEPSGLVRLSGADGTALADVRIDEAVPAMEHIARWTLLAQLTNPRSELTDLVDIEIVHADPGTVVAPQHGGTVPEQAGDEFRLDYRMTADGWQPPAVYIRLHNTSGRRLYCVLLDLTPGFKVHASLCPGEFIAPGAKAAALNGRRIKAFLPAGIAAMPGVEIRDQLKLLVAEEQFSPDPFLLPDLGRQVARSRGALESPGLLERVGDRMMHRELGPADPSPAYDWTTATVTLVTRVPG